DAITVLPICALLRCSSSRTTAISGAIPNQPKKHRKNDSQVMWKARIWGVRRLLSWMATALEAGRCMAGTLLIDTGKSCEPPRVRIWRACPAHVSCSFPYGKKPECNSVEHFEMVSSQHGVFRGHVGAAGIHPHGPATAATGEVSVSMRRSAQ